jgi:carboxyl-terminal processing protease
MQRFKYNRHFLITIFFLISFSLGTLVAQNRDLFKQIEIGFRYFSEVYRLLSRNYVDTLEPEELMKKGIEGMLSTLDPYTVFIEDDGINRLDQITTGKYGGIGMEIGQRNKQVVIIATMPNSPAQKAGLRPGDVIMEIEGQLTKDLSTVEVSKLLRGKIGTAVNIRIKRPLFAEWLPFEMVREEIEINEVPFAEFIEPGTVMIQLTGFSANSGYTVQKKLRELNKENKIKRVILDLRGNPGGLLQEAVKITNIFVPAGKLVVYTEGRNEKRRSYLTENQPMLPNAQLVVLINHGSASASEIVAGAIQDLDRGVVIGQSSFGKGLVQNVFNIANGDARLKVTTSRYYIPSGRSIQKANYSASEPAKADNTAEQPVFYTNNGRVVNEKGGITPDIEVTAANLSNLESELWRQGKFFKFAVEYIARHPEFTTGTKLSNAVVDSFYQFVQADSFDFEVRNEKAVAKLIAQARQNEQQELVSILESTHTFFSSEKQSAFSNYREDIRLALGMELNQTTGGQAARARYHARYDKTVLKALEVLNNQSTYALTLKAADK